MESWYQATKRDNRERLIRIHSWEDRTINKKEGEKICSTELTQ